MHRRGRSQNISARERVRMGHQGFERTDRLTTFGTLAEYTRTLQRPRTSRWRARSDAPSLSAKVRQESRRYPAARCRQARSAESTTDRERGPNSNDNFIRPTRLKDLAVFGSHECSLNSA